MQKAVKLGLGVALAAAFAATAFAQAAPDRAIKYRQGALQVLGWNMGIMGAMVKGERPYNKDEFLQRAMNVDHVAGLPWEGFGAGTDAGAPTKAKPEIWKEGAKFKQYQDALQAEAAKLVVAAKAGTLDAVKGPFGGAHDTEVVVGEMACRSLWVSDSIVAISVFPGGCDHDPIT